MGDFYDRIVMMPGELPIEDQFAKMGLKLDQSDEEFADIGFQYTPVRGQGLRIRNVHGPATDILQRTEMSSTRSTDAR
jgi:hypothetical protein